MQRPWILPELWGEAAHGRTRGALVDHVLPDVPVRQWVLSLPYRLRYMLAWDHDLCRTVVRVYVRAVLGFLRTRARRAGIANGRSGAVAIIQGGALNLNVHIHALVIDGVFAPDGERLGFHPAGRVTTWRTSWRSPRVESSGCRSGGV